jgi:hypothetical protein
MLDRASRSNSLGVQGNNGSITDLAGCGSRPGGTGRLRRTPHFHRGTAAILAEFAIIGTDRVAVDSA